MTMIPTLEDGKVTGHQKCTYDAWNRMVIIEASESTSADPVKKSVLAYDSLGRRISKTVTGSGEMNGTYHFYFDGQQIIETHDGASSGNVLEQKVFGSTYVDEPVQIAINQDPLDTTEDSCEYNSALAGAMAIGAGLVGCRIDSAGIRFFRHAHPPRRCDTHIRPAGGRLDDLSRPGDSRGWGHCRGAGPWGVASCSVGRGVR